MDSPQARIQHLQSEIHRLDAIISQGDDGSLKYSSTRPKLQMKLAEMREQNKVQKLMREKAAAGGRLKKLAAKKKLVVEETRAEQQQVIEKVKELEAYLESLYEIYHLHRSSLETAHVKEKPTNLAASVDTLQRQGAELSSEKAKLVQEQAAVVQKKEVLVCTIALSEEERATRLIQKAEFVAHREAAEEQLALFREKYSDECSYQLSQESVQALRTIRMQKQAILTQFPEVSVQVRELASHLHQLKEQQVTARKTQAQQFETAPSQEAVAEIDRLVNEINQKGTEVGLPSLQEFVNKQCGVSRQLFRVQHALVEKQARETEKVWNVERAEWQAKAELATVISEWDSLPELEDELARIDRKYQVKLKTLQDWLHSNTPQSQPEQSEIQSLLTYKHRLLAGIPPEKDSVATERSFNLLTNRLQRRETQLTLRAPLSAKEVQALQDKHLLLRDCRSNMVCELARIIQQEQALASRGGVLDPAIVEQVNVLRYDLTRWEQAISQADYMIDRELPLSISKSTKALDALNAMESKISARIQQAQHKEKKTAQELEKAITSGKRELVSGPNTQALKQVTRQIQAAKKELAGVHKAGEDISTRHSARLRKIEAEEAQHKAQLQKVDTQLTPNTARLSGKAALFQSRSLATLRRRGTLTFRETTRKELLAKLQPLLHGCELYKKISQRSAANAPIFDSLSSDTLSPEANGYALRVLKLDLSLTRIEIRIPYKGGVESTIEVSNILGPVLPKTTLKMMQSSLEDNDTSKGMYAFSLTLAQGQQLELLANSVDSLRIWVDGLTLLLKHKTK